MSARRARFAIATLVLTGTAFLAPSGFADGDTAPADTAQTAPKIPVPPEVGDTASDFELQDLADAPVKLSTLAKKTPVVLVMLRGFPG